MISKSTSGMTSTTTATTTIGKTRRIWNWIELWKRIREKDLLRFIIVIMLLHESFKEQSAIKWEIVSDDPVSETTNKSLQHIKQQQQQEPKLTFFLRMSGSIAKHRRRFWCTFFRSTVLFWNLALTDQIIVLLDDEKEDDHWFGDQIVKQIQMEFPNEYNIQVKYEQLPKDGALLWQKSGQEKRPFGYRRQLYSSFLTDNAINDDNDNVDDTLIVFMDSDAMFFAPVVKSSIFDEYYRPRVFGSDCTFTLPHVSKWYNSTQQVLGFPMIADFMSYFPVYIYSNTIRNCRNYLMQRFANNGTTFEEIYPMISPPGRNMSPICILLSYAWYFERERYSWSMEVCNSPTSRNQEINNPEHHVRPEHITETLPVPQTAFHKPYSNRITPVAYTTYCLADQYYTSYINSQQKNVAQSVPNVDNCSKTKFTLKDIYLLFIPNLQYIDRKDIITPIRCLGANEFDCIDRLEKHFLEYVQEVVERNRPLLDWNRTVRVDNIAQQYWNITCSSIKDIHY